MESLYLRITDHAAESRFFRQVPWSQAVRPWPRFGNRRTRLTVESILLGLALVFAVIWFSAPYFVRAYINRGLSGLPDYTGRVESVRIHPWIASLDIYDVRLDKRTGKIPVPFFYAPRWHISLQWSQIFHGVARASVIILDPQINLVSSPSLDQSQIYISKSWIDAIKELIPWRVNQVRIHRGEVHFLDSHASPPIYLGLDHLEIAAENMSNSEGLKVPLPATVTITARPLLTGTFAMNLAVNFDAQFATFTQSVRMEHVSPVGANAVLQQYLKVRVKSGEIALSSELSSDKGIYHGYVKSFFHRMEFEPNPVDEGNPGAIWSGILNVAKGLLENDKHMMTTQSEISGRLDQSDIDPVSALAGVLCHAYIQALRPGFDANYTPSAPTDTVTTPLTPSTEKEAALPSSPAVKN